MTTWTSGIGFVMAENELRRRERELRRARFLIAEFLRTCADLSERGEFPGLRATATDLDVGECAVTDFVEELLHRMHPHRYCRPSASCQPLSRKMTGREFLDAVAPSFKNADFAEILRRARGYE